MPVQKANCDFASAVLSTSGQGVELYISTAPLSRALRTQVESWLAQLKTVALESPTIPQHHTGLEVTGAQRAFIIALHRSSYAKFRPRLCGIATPWKLLSKTCKTFISVCAQFTAILTATDDHHRLSDDDCLSLHEAGRQFSAALTNPEFKKCNIWAGVEHVLHSSALLHIICSLISTAQAKRTRPALQNGLVVRWIGPSPPQTFCADMDPENLAKSWEPDLRRDIALRALQSANKLPPGLVQRGTTYIHDHAVVHCEAALLAYLVLNQIPAYPHLASSGDPCFCCVMYGAALKWEKFTDVSLRVIAPWAMPEHTPQDVLHVFRILIAHSLADALWDYRSNPQIGDHCL
ncbi:hypothetical protein K466DRAFT_568071 [Polyporus arcularius HHB13444]|uniref:Uncharacterized protein n=1 Tax=Polyporus arcularius HHB13444 TaxID=1314778 RepID=A0A5C3P221_9APHY|nr:hypothetical protein K466DRAFT_568071 [Polyporus arcularius HHB13444]